MKSRCKKVQSLQVTNRKPTKTQGWLQPMGLAHTAFAYPGKESSTPFHSAFPCTRRWCRQSGRRDSLQGRIGPQAFQLLHRGCSVSGQSLQTAADQSAREVTFSCHTLHVQNSLIPSSIYLHLVLICTSTLCSRCLEPKSEGHRVTDPYLFVKGLPTDETKS